MGCSRHRFGQGMCQAQAFADGSVQAQIAVYQTTCSEATAVLGPAADHAHGGPYSAAGFACEATVEGPGSQWAAAWGGTYFAYSCAKGTAQAAFNWGRTYIYGESGGGSSSGAPSTSGTPTFSAVGHHLLPTAVNQGMCQYVGFSDGSYAAESRWSARHARSRDRWPAAPTVQIMAYASGSFACKATTEGAGSPWTAAWIGTYYAYTCAGGSAQAAFNWGRHYNLGGGASGGGAGVRRRAELQPRQGHHLLPTPIGDGMCGAQRFPGRLDAGADCHLQHDVRGGDEPGMLGPAADKAAGAEVHGGQLQLPGDPRGGGIPLGELLERYVLRLQLRGRQCAGRLQLGTAHRR